MLCTNDKSCTRVCSHTNDDAQDRMLRSCFLREEIQISKSFDYAKQNTVRYEAYNDRLAKMIGTHDRVTTR